MGSQARLHISFQFLRLYQIKEGTFKKFFQQKLCGSLPLKVSYFCVPVRQILPVYQKIMSYNLSSPQHKYSEEAQQIRLCDYQDKAVKKLQPWYSSSSSGFKREGRKKKKKKMVGKKIAKEEIKALSSLEVSCCIIKTKDFQDYLVHTTFLCSPRIVLFCGMKITESPNNSLTDISQYFFKNNTFYSNQGLVIFSGEQHNLHVWQRFP